MNRVLWIAALLLTCLTLAGSVAASQPARLAPPIASAPQASWGLCVTGFLGDMNWDYKVNILDFSILATAYGKRWNEPGYNRAADLSCDGVVDQVDFDILQRVYGRELRLNGNLQ